MAIHKLTDLKIKAKIREIQDATFSPLAKTALLGDGDGLYLSVSKTGTTSWLFRYMDHGKARAVGLGGYPATTLSKAREKAQALRDARSGGIDPMAFKEAAVEEQRQRTAEVKTFKVCAKDYIDTKQTAWKNEKHEQQWRNTLEQYAYPVIGQLPINRINTDHIVKILKPVWSSKAETASRLRGRIEKILDWAKVHGLRQGENPARFKGHLEHLLPKQRAGAQKHHASLPYQQLPAFVKKLQDQSGMSRFALEFTILCAARTGETLGMTWSEVNLAKKIWIIPADRMKAGVEHRVHLCSRVVDILKEVKPFSGEKYVFISGKEDKPMSQMSMAMLLRRMHYSDITVHGMRTSMRVWSGECTDYPFEVCEQALAHKVGNAVSQAYLRTDYFDRRISLINDWASFCLSEV